MRKKKVEEENEGCVNTRIRYLVLFLGSACISSISSNMTTLNFTLICMGSVNETTGESLVFDEKTPRGTEGRGLYDYSAKERTMLMGSVGVGTLLAAWPFHLLYERFGARIVFFCAGVISTFATVLIPFIAARSFPLFVGLRVLQGISFGADFTAIGLITVHWASLKQHGFFISLLTSFSQISVIFTMPVAGELCESSWGWPSVYYVHAALSAFLFIIWVFFFRNDPAKHKHMTEIELEKIHRGKGEHIKQHEATPVKAIMTNPVMWAVWLSAFGELMMSQFIVMYAPTYLKEVLGFRVSHTGYFVAVPRALHLMFKIISGIASDRIKFISEKLKMVIFNSIALIISGSFFCILGFVSREYAIYALVVLLVIECSTGFICGGFYKCATIVARQHSHFVLSQIQFIKCLSLFIEPLLVFVFSRHNTVAEWRIVFLIHGILLISAVVSAKGETTARNEVRRLEMNGNIVFSFFATDEPADFTYTKEELAEKKRVEIAKDPEKKKKRIGIKL